MTLDNLIGKGLQREATDAAEIGRFLAKIHTKLHDAGAHNISMESRFDIAYEALLEMADGLLRHFTQWLRRVHPELLTLD